MGVTFEITPEPTPDERAAIEAALAPLLAGGTTPTSAWWRAGILEAVEDQASSSSESFSAGEAPPARSRAPTPT